MERRVENTFKIPLWGGPEEPGIMIRNRNLNNSKPLPPITYTQRRDMGENSKQEEANINSALQHLQIHVPLGDRKWANSQYKPSILPPIRQSVQHSVRDIENAKSEESDHQKHTRNDTRQKMALITEKMQHLNHMHADKDLADKTCLAPVINIRQVIPNLEALNYDSDLKFPEKNSADSKEDEPIAKKSLEIVRTVSITTFLDSKSSKRRTAICKILDQAMNNGLEEYYRRLSVNALLSVFPDMQIAIENMDRVDEKSPDFTSF